MTDAPKDLKDLLTGAAAAEDEEAPDFLDEQPDDDGWDLGDDDTWSDDDLPPAAPTPANPRIGLLGREVPEDDIALTTHAMEETEAGVSERFVAMWGHKYRVSPSTPDGLLYQWDGRVWRLAKIEDSYGDYISLVRHCRETEPQFLTDPDPDIQRAMRGKRRAWLKGAETTARHKAVMRAVLSGSFDGMVILDDAWDADPDLLNTPTGVYRLSERDENGLPKRYDHDPSFLCSQITRGSGDPSAQPTNDVEALFEGLNENAGLYEIMRAVAATGVTGHSPRFMALAYGAAGAGKSTTGEALVAALGDYAATVSPDLFTASNSSQNGANANLLDIRGRRMAMVDEAAHIRLDTNLVKTVSAGGELAARQLYSKTMTRWVSTITLLFCANGPLHFSVTDEGMIDRFYPACVGHTLTRRRDPRLKDRLTRDQANLDALLAWAMRAATDWLAAGGTMSDLDLPDVEQERARYRREANPLSEFIEEALDREPTTDDGVAWEVTAQEAYWAYVQGERGRTVKYSHFIDLLAEAGIAVGDPDSRPTRARKARYGIAAHEMRGRWLAGIRYQPSHRTWYGKTQRGPQGPGLDFAGTPATEALRVQREARTAVLDNLLRGLGDNPTDQTIRERIMSVAAQTQDEEDAA